MWKLWAAALFWGLNWPAVKIILASSSPWTLRAAGLTGGAILLTLATKFAGQSFKIQRSDWRNLFVASLLNVAGFNICAVFAQLNLPTSRATILTFTMPLWAALLGWIFLRERLDGLRASSLALGALGICVLSVPFWDVVKSGGLPFGLVYAFGAAISWAAGTVWLKRYPLKAAPLASTAWQVIIAAVICIAGMLTFETPNLDLSRPAAAAAFAYHIALPQALAYVLWFGLIRSVPASTAALGTLLIPIFGVAGAIVILDDWPAPLDVVGLALILSAVALDQIVRGWRTSAVPIRD
jgi:drug/metabolite transporter (DMT)-like permease